MTRNRSFASILALSLTSLVGAAACDPQVDGDHPGDSLTTLSGTITNERAQAPAEAYATLLWRAEGVTGRDVLYAESTAVRGAFPASFELELYQPPADAVLFDLGPNVPRLGLAYIAVFNKPADELVITNQDSLDAAMLGLAEHHAVIYADRPLAAGERFENLHGPLQAGYNIMRVERRTPEEQAQYDECAAQATTDEEWDACGSRWDALVPAEGSGDVQIRMVDDQSELKFPFIS